MAPVYLSDVVQSYVPPRSLQAAEQLLLSLPKSQLKLLYCGPEALE